MKKIVTVLLVAILCVSSIAPMSAARNVSFEEDLAQDLKSLGIFRGVSDTEFDLGRAPTRVEALVMLIRLIGKSGDATSGEWSHPFLDVPQWADAYVGYAYENGLTKGVSETEFGAGDANIQMFLTFVLRSLDYTDKDGADFTYSDPYTLAYHTGILPSGVNKEKFLRADVVLISYAALSAYLKNTDTTLASKLIDEGVFSKEDFAEYYDKNALKNIPEEVKEPEKDDAELSAEEILKQCSSAVFYIEVYDKKEEAFASGSGFFINSEGVAVTNYHVIEGAYSGKIMIGDKENVYDVEFVYDYSKEEDWAVIQIDGSGFDYLEIGDESTIIGGASVYAIGSPLGLKNTISQGIISNANRTIGEISFIQTSAAISSGSSGGALINKYGQVIGITSAKFSDGENLGLALPMSIIEDCDYSGHKTLAQIAGEKNSNVIEKYSAEEILEAFVAVNANDSLNDKKAYTRTIETDNGYFDLSIIIEDYGLSVLVWQVYKGDTYFCSLDLTGDDRFLYYSYKYSKGGYYLTGTNWIDPSSVIAGRPIKFDKIEGNAKVQVNEELAGSLIELGLDFVDLVFGIIAENGNFKEYTVADLGFVNFK